LRIYEHLKQYERIGHRTVEIDYLKRIFEITTEYPLFANFYQKIIQPAEQDINLHSDLTITHIGKLKRGRRVESLDFRFHPKSPIDRYSAQEAKESKKVKALPTPTSVVLPVLDASQSVDNEDNRLFNKFKTKVVDEFGVSPAVFLTELKGRGEAAIQKAIRITEGVQKKGEVKNMAGFFVEALRKSFTNDAEKRTEKQTQVLQKQARLAELRQSIENLKDQQAEDLQKRVREMTMANPELAEQTVQVLRTKGMAKTYIESLETDFGRPLVMQDFRDIKRLRNLVLEMIFNLNQSEFKDITEAYALKIQAVEKVIKGLM
jgi:hypothetical protein